MAFCPNCGTPNTDQAEKCVSCAFELSAKQKAKFKGTIMMSGVQAAKPQVTPAPVAAPQPSPGAPSSAASPTAPTGKNLAFEKTMMGPMIAPGSLPLPSAPAGGGDLARAATVEGPAPFPHKPLAQPSPQQPAAPQGSFQQPVAQQPSFQQPVAPQPAFQQPVAPQPSFQQPQAAQPATASAPAQPASFGGAGFGAGSAAGGFSDTGSGSFGNTGGFGGGGGGGGGGEFGSSMAPPVPKNNTGKYLAIGCAAVLVLACIVGGLVFFVAKDKLGAMAGELEKEGDAAQWRGSLVQSLTQVTALCQTDCNSAAVYFHPQVQASLGSEAKQLNPARLQKLIDPTQSEARMLNATDDTGIAQGLSLDPTQCVRIVAAAAKIVGCSVPDPSGTTASLRIVHMAGIGSL